MKRLGMYHDLHRLVTGHSLIKSVWIEPANEDGMCEVHFHRAGKWNVFGFGMYKHTYYIRQSISEVNHIFLKKSIGAYPHLHRRGIWHISYDFETIGMRFLRKTLNVAWWTLFAVVWINFLYQRYFGG